MYFHFTKELVPDLELYLQLYYHKILKVDLTHDTFEIVLLQNDDKAPDHNCLSKWLKDFAEARVASYDKEEFLQKTDIETMKSRMFNGETDFYYDRYMDNGYYESEFILLPRANIDPDKVEGILFVKEIELAR